MDEAKLTEKLIEKTYTRKDMARRLRFLREYFEGGYFTFSEDDVTKFLVKKRAITDDIEAFMGFGEDFFRTFTKETFYKKIQGIAEAVRKLPVVTVYIPYEPVPAEIVRLGKWFREHIGKTTVLEIKTDATLLGGCAFVFKGTYRDYSLRYYMMKKREEISKVITEYVEKFYKET
jgi:hypothetical protein